MKKTRYHNTNVVVTFEFKSYISESNDIVGENLIMAISRTILWVEKNKQMINIDTKYTESELYLSMKSLQAVL